MTSKKCVVTGANGFVGVNIVRKLIERGHSVVALVGADMSVDVLKGLPVEIRVIDLLDAKSVQAGVAGAEWLFHTAACYNFWAPKRKFIYDVNVEGTRLVMDAAKATGCEKVVYTSSSATLSPALESAMGDEENLYDLRSFQGHYKCSKMLAELVVLRMAAQGFPVCIVHPTVVIGKGDRRPTPTGDMIVHYINGRMKAYVDMILNVVDVEDVAEGHILAMEKGVPGHRYVLGGENMPMPELLDFLQELTGIAAPRFAIPRRFLRVLGRMNEWFSDHFTGRPPLIMEEAALHARGTMNFNSYKAQRELGYNPKPARVAIGHAVDWFLLNGYCKNPRLQKLLLSDLREAESPPVKVDVALRATKPEEANL